MSECECPHCFLLREHLPNCPTLGMSLRALWIENRRRRAAGLPAVDRKGIVRPPPTPPRPPLSDEQIADLYARTAASYDPASPHYRQYQGD